MAYKTIILKGLEFCPQEEAVAAEAGIYPGMLLDIDSSGLFELQDESENVGPLLVAVEDTLQGALISTAYTVSTQVLARWLAIGTEFYGWLAPYHNVSIGTLCSFAGYESPGALGAAQQSSANLGAGARFIAKEAVNNSAGATAVRCRFQRVC